MSEREMQGVVTLLDQTCSRRVKTLWTEGKREADSPELADLRYPHFSYHVAETFASKPLAAILRSIAAKTPPFRARISGLGIFTGKRKILYVSIVRSMQLDFLHRQIWNAAEEVSIRSSPFYRADEWIPQITLAEGEMGERDFAKLTGRLSERNFRWEFEVRHLALLVSDDGKMAVKLRFPLRGRG